MKFSELTDKHAVWCDTEEKAEMLCKFMDSLGLKWLSENSYKDNYWFCNKKKTCYDVVRGSFCKKKYYEERDYIIIPFDDLELDGMFGQVTSKKSKIDIHKEICSKLNETYKAKNNDYGDSFAKLRTKYPNAILIRLEDKLNRLDTLMSGTKQEVDESIDDTLLDLANYAIMELVERRK